MDFVAMVVIVGVLAVLDRVLGHVPPLALVHVKQVANTAVAVIVAILVMKATVQEDAKADVPVAVQEDVLAVVRTLAKMVARMAVAVIVAILVMKATVQEDAKADVPVVVVVLALVVRAAVRENARALVLENVSDVALGVQEMRALILVVAIAKTVVKMVVMDHVGVRANGLVKEHATGTVKERLKMITYRN